MIQQRILLLDVIFFSLHATAQDGEEKVNLTDFNTKKHELRIDAVEGLIVPAIYIGYEYVLSKYSGIGLSVNIALDSEGDLDFPQEFAVTPYYRQYFFNRKDYGARGFYAEGLLQYATGDESVFFFDELTGISSRSLRDWSQFGVGFAIGQKWVSRNGFVVELSLGGGRYFGGEDFAPGGFFRGGASIGYRF